MSISMTHIVACRNVRQNNLQKANSKPSISFKGGTPSKLDKEAHEYALTFMEPGLVCGNGYAYLQAKKVFKEKKAAEAKAAAEKVAKETVTKQVEGSWNPPDHTYATLSSSVCGWH